MALTPDQQRRARTRRVNLLMAYAAAFASTKGFRPSSLFAAGEQGVWFDPSDFSSMFQDSAGSTPVTAVEQPVGRINDKSGRANHATQGTSAARPVLRARYNLLTFSEQFDNAAWTKANTTITANTVVAPDGTTTADTIAATTTGNFRYAHQQPTLIQNTTYRFSVYVKTKTAQWVWLLGEQAADAFAAFDVINGVAGTRSAGLTSSITSAGDGWYLCSITFTVSSATGAQQIGVGVSDSNTIVNMPVTAGIDAYIWGADLRATNDGIGLPAYQRIAAATDYDTAGFPPYLDFDGTDDSLATGNIDLSATDKVAVFAGVRKGSDAARGMLLEFTNASTNRFQIEAPQTAGTGYIGSSGGATVVFTPGTNFPAPDTAVLTLTADISADTVSLSRNRSLIASSTSDQGAGNYANSILYIGRRGGATLPYNGRLYSLIVLGRTATAVEIANTEAWVNGKTGAY